MQPSIILDSIKRADGTFPLTIPSGQPEDGENKRKSALTDRLRYRDLAVLLSLLKIEAVGCFDVLGNTGRCSHSVSARLGASGNFGGKDPVARFTGIERA